MELRANDLDPQATYKLLTGVVVPRPVAWVCTRSVHGLLNLAPFSAFTFVSTKPPLLGINIGRKAGQRKDTARNILDAGEYVVHICDEPLVEAVHDSAGEYPADVSEVGVLGLKTTPSVCISVPRIAAAPIAMECRRHQVIPFGATGAEFFVGEVLNFHVRDDLLAKGKIDSAALNPICRLAGPRYATLGRVISLRPLVQADKAVLDAGCA